jgi:hypothetical protein
MEKAYLEGLAICILYFFNIDVMDVMIISIQSRAPSFVSDTPI